MENQINIAALQIGSLSFDKAKLDYYLTIAKSKKCSVFVIGEYVVNLFFKELEKISFELIREQSEFQKKSLKELAKSYNITIIAPIILVEKKRLIKAIVKFSPNFMQIYEQQVLINYPHWNEEKFFDNEIKPLATPMIFNIKKIKCAVMFGFEIHYDNLWLELQKKRVDVVIIPTASTFDSKERWRELLKSRSFLNNLYILRVNKVGNFLDKKTQWNFYGDSLLTSPCGNLIQTLGSKEEMMIATIDKDTVIKSRKEWGFYNAIQKRNLI